MKLLVISDLHLDFWGVIPRHDRSLNFDPILKPLAVTVTNKGRTKLVLPTAHVLVVAGDTLNGIRANLLSRFLKAARQHYPTVIIILGNHEYHSSVDMAKTEQAFRQVCGAIAGVIALVSDSVYINDPDRPGRQVAFHGTTLWAALEPAPTDPVPDFFKIKVPITGFSADSSLKGLRTWTAVESQAVFRANVVWLATAITAASQRGIDSVVVTHHAPLTQGTFAARYADSATLSSYVSDLSGFLAEHSKVKPQAGLIAWLFGHTHHYTDLIESDVRVYSNPLGYQDETEPTGYKAGMVIEV